MFVGQLDESPRSLTLQKTTWSLQELAEAGCFICSLYWKRAQRTGHRLARDPLRISGELKCVLVVGHEASPWHAHELLLQFEEEAVLPLSIWLETCWTKHAHYNQRSRPSRTPVTRSLVEQWPQNCREDMATCNQQTGSPLWIQICGLTQKWLETRPKDHSHKQPAWLPTRLNDLGTSKDQCVKLVDTRSTTRGLNATISYRWADTAVVQTTSSNLEQFLHAIPLAGLSKTFQDASTAARSYLDVIYIWIDSSSIIQDDSQDWRAVMQGVYYHSFCNLSAIAKSLGAHGLFPLRDIDHVRSREVEMY